MNDFYELAHQVNTIAFFEIIVMICLWAAYHMMMDCVKYIKEKIKAVQDKQAE